MSVYSGYIPNISTLYSTILVLRPHLYNKHIFTYIYKGLQGALKQTETPHPLNTVDAAMIIVPFGIHFPVLLHCASYKSCHPAGIYLK